MKITELHVYGVDLHIANGPYVMSGSSLERVDSTIVELVTDTGLKAYGETCPVGPTYQPEHALGARAALAEMGPHLIGTDALNAGTLHRTMNHHLNGHNYAKAAIDVAHWDLLGKALGARVCDLFGGALREEVPAYYAISVGAPDDVACQALEQSRQGYGRLQIKVGGRPIALDIETIHKVWEAVGRSVRLVADANRAWTSRDALHISKACRDIPIILEQPCNTMAETARVRRMLEHPVYLDESTEDLDDILSAVGSGLCDGFGFKIGRLGGLSSLRTARDICKSRSLPHTCDDGFGGDIIAAACVHAGATVEAHLNEGVWIAEPYLASHYDPEGGIAVSHGKISVPMGTGLGVNPSADHLGTPIASYG